MFCFETSSPMPQVGLNNFWSLAFSSQVLGLQACSSTPSLWVVRSQAQDLVLAQQAFYQLSYNLSPNY